MAGRPPRVTDEELVAIFEAADDPVLTTVEVAEEVPIGRKGLHPRLDALVKKGTLEKKSTGQVTIWWLSE